MPLWPGVLGIALARLTYRTHRIEAPMLAEILVQLLGELPEVEPQRWTRRTP